MYFQPWWPLVPTKRDQAANSLGFVVGWRVSLFLSGESAMLCVADRNLWTVEVDSVLTVPFLRQTKVFESLVENKNYSQTLRKFWSLCV